MISNRETTTQQCVTHTAHRFVTVDQAWVHRAQGTGETVDFTRRTFTEESEGRPTDRKGEFTRCAQY